MTAINESPGQFGPTVRLGPPPTEMELRQLLADLNRLAATVFDEAKARGWHTNPPNLSNHLMNLHAEVSEAWEEHRSKRTPRETYYREDGKPEGIPTELADVLIRVLDTAAAFDIDIAKAVFDKLLFNRTRPHRHGGKQA